MFGNKTLYDNVNKALLRIDCPLTLEACLHKAITKEKKWNEKVDIIETVLTFSVAVIRALVK